MYEKCEIVYEKRLLWAESYRAALESFYVTCVRYDLSISSIQSNGHDELRAGFPLPRHGHLHNFEARFPLKRPLQYIQPCRRQFAFLNHVLLRRNTFDSRILHQGCYRSFSLRHNLCISRRASTSHHRRVRLPWFRVLLPNLALFTLDHQRNRHVSILSALFFCGNRLHRLVLVKCLSNWSGPTILKRAVEVIYWVSWISQFLQIM